jgi:Flp pilus assembly protein TadG
MMKRIELRSGESGQGLVVVVISMLVILGMMALVLDSGWLVVQRRHVQNAADAAALAGAQQLGKGSTDSAVLSSVQNFATVHNKANTITAQYYPGGEEVGQGSIPVGATGVTVTATIQAETFFAGLFGIDDLTTTARSGARYGGVAEMTTGVYPIAVEWENFQYGQSYNIWAGGGPGNFGWLGWDGCTNTPCLCTSLTPPGNSENYVNPYDSDDDVLSIGDWVQGSTGKKNASCVRSKLDNFINNATPITIVVWDQAQGSGSNLNYHIAGFAVFIVESYNLPSNRITGHFIQWVVPVSNIQDGANYGVYGVSIIKDE